ncbi:MAG: glycosyltransferase family 4 protein [Bacteroidales bacterium]|nr:glycosyltransferase family 4 protein [Bacteroidales bacterium]
MNILYIHQFFKTPFEPGGTRSYWFARELISNGYTVTMLTSKSDLKKSIEIENIDNIKVIYIRNAYSNEMGIMSRFFSFFKFMLKSSYYALKEKGIDMVYATSTPLSVGVPALILKWIKRIPFIFEVRDLWPEVPIQMGALKKPLVRRLAIMLEKSIYRNAKHIVALSPGMKEGILKRSISSQNITVIPNMSKIDKFFLREKNKELMKKHGLKEDNFYIIHFGAMGIANGLDYIIDAAKIIQNQSNNKVNFIFAGKGKVEKHLKQRCIEEKIHNVYFLGFFAMEEMSDIVNIADCSVVPFKNIPILKTNSPNKLFDSLSAQKAVIVNSSGWTKEMVEEYNCGAYVDPEKPVELANLLIEWNNDKQKLTEMGENARRLAEDVYDKSILTKQFIGLINSKLIKK